jgi:hypothetical protein
MLWQVKLTRAAYPHSPVAKPMERMHSAPLHAHASSENQVKFFQSTDLLGTLRYIMLTLFCRIFDLPSLVSWLSSRQYAPEGGLAGRTNKLVDGCYSHWIGGCWPLINAATLGSNEAQAPSHRFDGLFSREGLIRYILCCCQQPGGGLRDKPSKLVLCKAFTEHIETDGRAEHQMATTHATSWQD